MPRSPITAELRGIDAGLRFLDPESVVGARKRALLRAVMGAQRVAQHGAPGSTSRSIMTEVKPLRARVYSIQHAGKMNTLEVGRAAGRKPPPILPLLDWMRRSGFAGNVMVLSRSIGRRGFRGHFFMRAAQRWVQNNWGSILSKMGHDIENEAKKRAARGGGV